MLGNRPGIMSVVSLALLALVSPVMARACQDNAPSSGDTSRAHDYARQAGSPDAKKLSTGWKSSHGKRTVHVRDHVQRERNGKTEHVHSYYRSHKK